MTTINPLIAPWGRFHLYTFFIDAPSPAVVDTGVASTPAEGIRPELAKLGERVEDIEYILLTHGHIDHLGGAHALWEMTGRRAKVVIHADDLKYLQARRAHVDNYLGLRDNYIDNPNAEAEQTAMAATAISGEMDAHLVVHGGELIDLGGGVSVEVIHVPGHSMGSVAYRVNTGEVFVGDAVQVHGAANGFPGYEDPGAYRSSLHRIRGLAPTRMFMGHPYRTAEGEPYPVDQDAPTAMRAIEESIAIEDRIHAVARTVLEQGHADATAPYAPFTAIAAQLGYTGDPTLEPSPFFTTLDGYRRIYAPEEHPLDTPRGIWEDGRDI
ncbi:MBL fold metallo-hydrolase [Corynebacterium guangdongense]|uniref:Glyoxylase-like metal-dependent hydrolase (Beta-lactamase superfamily II) n=1 Tax=Corynebacterium guangdongense TaxID=1783348 RepID=A0ABU1ZZ30_9CORY|nr:glyoxylase-like metal-dependent hydrolase (beta-lactamase superfamily II) [Corynebacterium guangdongense]WJZ18658.1 Hydroxyacylglutathione hydrolase [Corynebacterium guangdongense]